MSFVCKQSIDGTEMAGVEGFAVVSQKLAEEFIATDKEEKKRPQNLAVSHRATQMEANIVACISFHTLQKLS